MTNMRCKCSINWTNMYIFNLLTLINRRVKLDFELTVKCEVWACIFWTLASQMFKFQVWSWSGEDESLSWTWFHILWKFASTFTFYCQGSAQNFHIAIIMIFLIFVLADVMLISSLRLKTCFLLGKGQTVYRVSWTWRAMHGTVSFKSWPKFNSTAEFAEGAFSAKIMKLLSDFRIQIRKYFWM